MFFKKNAPFPFMRLLFLLTLSVSCLLPQFGFGQARTFTNRTRIPPIPKAPKAVVVLLPSGKKRIDALTRMGDTYQLETMTGDLEQVRKRIIADFRDNYKYGTYYFLPDSADILAEETDWTKMLLDKNGAPAKEVIVGVNDTDFMFTYYNYWERQKVRVNTLTEGKGISYEAGGVIPIYKAWVLTDYQLNAYPEKLSRRRNYSLPAFKGPNPRRVYYYESSLFDVNYRASAFKLWENLYEFLGPPRTN